MNNFLPFSRPCLNQKTIDNIISCLQSNWISTGPLVAEFEEKIAHYIGVKNALTLTSATGGLFLSFKALDIKEGDEIITTPLTFVATINTIIHAGAKPILVDIDTETRNINVSLIERVITKKTKAIVPVHFGGLPVDMDPLLDIARKYNLVVVEDAAHAMGATYKNRKIGSFGDIQVFSFHPCKNMTSAEGGCIVTNNDTFADRIKSLRFFGIDRNAWSRHSKFNIRGYDVLEAGYKFNMSDLQASIGLSQIEVLDDMNQKRMKLASYYRTHLNDIKGVSLPRENSFDHENAWHLFTVLINKKKFGIDRHDFSTYLKGKGIGTGYHYPPIHFYTYFKENFGWKRGDFPNAESVGDSIISLPLFPDMNINDCNRVINAIKECKNN